MRKFQILSLFTIVAMLTTGTASAATFGAEVYGAFNTHSMGDWNDLIDDSNSLGSDFQNVENGFTGGLDLRMWATPTWLFTAGWEPLFLSTEDDASPGNKLSFDAQSFSVSGAYFFPTGGTAKYGIGAGGAYYTITGDAEQGPPPTTTIDLEGNGIGFHFMGLGEWTVSPGFSVTGTAGYRIANIDEIKADGTVVESSPGTNVETDYSGFLARVGLAFYLPTSK